MTSIRRLARIIVIQSFYEKDIGGGDFEKKELLEIFDRLVNENGLEDAGVKFGKMLITGVASKKKEIDAIIESASDSWTLDKMGLLDRNILRLGVFELLFGSEFDVPEKVAINEAIELGKTFVGQATGKFVNGVLGKVLREIGGVPEVDSEKKEKRIKMSVGALIYRLEKGTPKFALVHDIFGKWTLSKGGVEKSETHTIGLARVIKDELGIVGELEEEIGSNSYVSHPPEGPIRKEVTYYIMKTNEIVLHLKDSEGLEEANWFTAEQVKSLNLYSDIKQMISDAVDKVESAAKFERLK